MARVIAPAFLAFALAAACERPATDQTPPPAADPVAADPAMEATNECVNRVEGYTVTYPANWYVNTPDILGPCSLFDPEPIEVPRNSELPLEIAVMIGVEPVPFSTLAGDVMGRRVLSLERATVDGREAMRIHGESTGEGLHDAGIHSYEYFVDLGGRTMAAATYDAGTLPFERKRRILDGMMAAFRFNQSR